MLAEVLYAVTDIKTIVGDDSMKFKIIAALAALTLCMTACASSGDDSSSKAEKSESSSAAVQTTTTTAASTTAPTETTQTEESEPEPDDPPENEKEEIDVAANSEEYCDGAKDIIEQWNEHMSNAEYTMAAQLMSDSAAQDMSIGDYTDGETPEAQSVQFGRCMLKEENGVAIITVDTTFIPDADPSYNIEQKITVQYDGEKYIICEIIDEGISIVG